MSEVAVLILLFIFLLLLALPIFAAFVWRLRNVEAALSKETLTREAAEREVESLAHYRVVRDADAEAARILASARGRADTDVRLAEEKAQVVERQAYAALELAKAEAAAVRRLAIQEAEDARQTTKRETDQARSSMVADRAALKADVQARLDAADAKVAAAAAEANRIIELANQRALEIAGAALDAKNKVDVYEKGLQAVRNLLDGYGDRYITPTYGLLDELAEEFGHTEAGQSLQNAREHSQRLVKIGHAGTCEYVESNRREAAIRFVVDAFNGKVDSVLSRTRAGNIGTLRQQVTDAFNLVNLLGVPFRNARITQMYLDARLEELKWGVVARELKEREREEQRRIREQIREEERAQREFEKAQKDAAKEEGAIQKALARVQAEMESAGAVQREKYEAQMADLQEKLKIAEEKSKKALSMAQQTKAGHVYVISNIGSFGEEVFKIGMTRRLEPMERVQELGDASVPFPFDVHAMIYHEDAPGLEQLLHKHFVRMQVNKVNPRKEFFRVPIGEVRRQLDTLGLVPHWTMVAEAREYRESLAIEKALQTDPEARQEWLQYQQEAEATLGTDES